MPRMMQYCGQRFGRITVIGDSFRRGGGTYARGRCDCGREADYFMANLKNGSSTQCRNCGAQQGGRKQSLASDSMGMCSTSLWHQHQNYRRNKCIVPEWVSFRAFHAAVGNPPEEARYIRRPNRVLPLGPSNWEWSPKRGVGTYHRAEELKGKTLKWWGEQFGVTRERVRQLLNKLGSIEKVCERMQMPRDMRHQLGRETVKEKHKTRIEAGEAIAKKYLDGAIHLVPIKDLPCSAADFRQIMRSHGVRTAIFDNGATIVLQLRK